jgi:hypothetical protein
MVRPVGSEFLVNDIVKFGQHDSAVTALSDGGFAIGWVNIQSVLTQGPVREVILPISDQIRGRAFDAAGQPIASSAILSEPTNPHDTYFSALDSIRLANGNVAFAWRTQYTDVYEEQARSFSSNLTPTSGLNVPEFGGSQAPRGALDIAPTEGDSYLLAFWADESGRIEALTGESRVFSDTITRGTVTLALADLPDENAALIYYGPILSDDDGSPDTLNFQLFDPAATALGSPHEIPTNLTAIDAIDTALLTNGNIVLVLGETGSAKSTVMILDPDGNVVVPAFEAGNKDVDVAALSGGGFVLAWTAGGDGSGSAIKAEVFSNSGVAQGPEILVNSHILNNQFDPHVAGLANGDFVVSWTDASGQGGDISGTSIKARVFTLEGLDRPAGSIESTAGNDTLRGTPGGDIFFFDTAGGQPLGNDVIKGFGAGDRIVTTTAIFDGNADGRIGLDSSDRLTLPGAASEPTASTGIVKIFYENGKALSHLNLLGVEVHEGANYYVYGGAGDHGAEADLLF